MAENTVQIVIESSKVFDDPRRIDEFMAGIRKALADDGVTIIYRPRRFVVTVDPFKDLGPRHL